MNSVSNNTNPSGDNKKFTFTVKGKEVSNNTNPSGDSDTTKFIVTGKDGKSTMEVEISKNASEEDVREGLKQISKALGNMITEETHK
ncbi:MAG: hypothetical protein ACKO3R_04165 [bacterium]